MWSKALGNTIVDGGELLEAYIASHQACLEAVSRQHTQAAVAKDELCAALMDEYVEWLSVMGKDALPETKGVTWAMAAEEQRQLKIMNMMIDRRAEQKTERERKLGANGAWIAQMYDAEMAKKLSACPASCQVLPMWSEA